MGTDGLDQLSGSVGLDQSVWINRSGSIEVARYMRASADVGMLPRCPVAGLSFRSSLTTPSKALSVVLAPTRSATAFAMY
jgi:hypothetical protein